MTPRTHRRVIWGLALGLLLLLLVVYGVGYLGQRSVRAELEKSRIALERSELTCPDEGRPRIERWGEIGWSRYCEVSGQKDGPWQAWENQRLAIQGAYADAERHGTWTWFHSDGSVYRQKTYHHGEELSDQIVAEESAAR